jgi:hypothetical protein
MMDPKDGSCRGVVALCMEDGTLHRFQVGGERACACGRGLRGGAVRAGKPAAGEALFQGVEAGA